MARRTVRRRTVDARAPATALDSRQPDAGEIHDGNNPYCRRSGGRVLSLTSVDSVLDPAPASGNFAALRFGIAGPMLVMSRGFTDDRGVFTETYSHRDFAALGIADEFVQDNECRSIREGTVRGLHFQLPPRAQAKLVRVLRGAILDVVVDLRRSSGSHGRHLAVGLDAAEGHQLYIPPGFAHGFCTLEPGTTVAYKVSAPYTPELDRCLAWDDPDLALPWPLGRADAVLSERDRRAPRLRDLPACFD
jgi:dTDP-4-dehydrorhamnose 3,5-epimerase